MTDYKALKLMRNGCEYCFPGSGGGGGSCVDLLLIGGGGSGGGYYGGGGGAGGVIYSQKVAVSGINHFCIGQGGTHYPCKAEGINGGNSSFNGLEAIGGGGGGTIAAVYQYSKGCNGGSGGGAAMRGCANYCGTCYVGGWGCPAQGTHGGDSCINVCTSSYCSTGGGGGAGGTGGSPFTTCPAYGYGGKGINVNICGTSAQYAGGGGGVGGYGCYGGGNGGTTAPTSATTPGSGGGGGTGTNIASCAGNGKEGIGIIRYHKDGSDGITCAIGGCKYECGDYMIHKYTSNGGFIVNPKGSRYLDYLVVGGGGGGGRGGGGGGAVCIGTIENPSDSYEIVVGCGGCKSACSTGDSCNGGASCLGDVVVANGGKGACDQYLSYKYWVGGESGSGCRGGCNGTNCDRYGGGGGGGAAGIGTNTDCYYAGNGGAGIAGYGGGGGGGSCTNYWVGGKAVDGGGLGGPGNQSCVNNTPKNCGGGGGGSYVSACAGNGACGVVDICYPSDGSYGFSSATGGNSCYLCGNICVHRFTSNGTFTIVS